MCQSSAPSQISCPGHGADYSYANAEEEEGEGKDRAGGLAHGADEEAVDACLLISCEVGGGRGGLDIPGKSALAASSLRLLAATIKIALFINSVLMKREMHISATEYFMQLFITKIVGRYKVIAYFVLEARASWRCPEATSKSRIRCCTKPEPR
jgi:hypothetical protein